MKIFRRCKFKYSLCAASFAFHIFITKCHIFQSHIFLHHAKKKLNNFVLNKYFLTRDLTFREENSPNRRAGQNEFFLHGSTRSYASNRKYRKRGNSEIGVNERILRQAAIKELVSLRRLRALLWSIRKLTRSDKQTTFGWSRQTVFSWCSEEEEWENVERERRVREEEEINSR